RGVTRDVPEVKRKVLYQVLGFEKEYYFSAMNVSLPYCVYVLFSELDKKLYVGYTNCIDRRIKEHFNGESKSTKHRRPLKLIFLEYYLFKEDAKYRELYFKSSKGKRMLKLMLANTFDKLGYKSVDVEDLDHNLNN
ncbi:MAG TPA: GIY-YIG nuclease family protein, partial [Bacteroidia bacterium]